MSTETSTHMCMHMSKVSGYAHVVYTGTCAVRPIGELISLLPHILDTCLYTCVQLSIHVYIHLTCICMCLYTCGYTCPHASP